MYLCKCSYLKKIKLHPAFNGNEFIHSFTIGFRLKRGVPHSGDSVVNSAQERKVGYLWGIRDLEL